MTFEEAEAVRLMIDGHWNLHMNDSTAELWRSILLTEDALASTAVVAHLAKKLHYAPKISDFREVMRLLYPPAAPPSFDPLPESKRGVQAPEWVWVWSWARWHRDPREERGFPQQDGNVDPTTMMTTSDYELLLIEWKDAGSPKASTPLPVLA